MGTNEPDGDTATRAALFQRVLIEWLNRWSIPATTDQVAKLLKHYLAMVDANRRVNLTRITEPEEAAVKHYVDSLAPLLWLGDRRSEIHRVLDVGTGAGFPAVPLAVMCPEWHVTAIDATRKKTDFLSETTRAIQLQSVHPIHARSEQWEPDEPFDLVLTRAVASIDRCVAWAGRHVADRGRLVCFTTPDGAEPDRLRREAKKHGLHATERFSYELAVGEQRIPRILQVFQRTEPT